MKRRYSRNLGVTLVELIVALTLLAILAALATPSFLDTRERAVLRGAADQLVSFWGTARFEAVKRSQYVKVSFKRSGNSTCVGASMTAVANDNTTCDCFTAGSCPIGQFPASQDEWKGAVWNGAPALGDSSTSGVVVIDPKTGFLTEASDAGSIDINSSTNTNHYRLRFAVDAQGRTGLCEPAAAPKKMPDYGSKSC